MPLALALLGGSAACDMMAKPAPPVEKPAVMPAALPAPKPAVARPTSQKSAELRSYLAQVQRAQTSQGLLRRDGGGVDTPYTANVLARNFEQIAFFNEYNGTFSGRGGASPLRRWAGPVRMEVLFGDGVPPSQRRGDASDIRKYASRLAAVTGHSISTSGPPNFIVIVASEDDRADVLQQAAAKIPGISPASLQAMSNLRRDTYCAVAAYAGGDDENTYTAAIAVIRSENPTLLRLSCIHEELAQGLGLANDSPAARPSIFNDDDEFALLTKHDELLLKMLYNPRLRIGMRLEEARPIVKALAENVIGTGG